jgi:hypothetical protein
LRAATTVQTVQDVAKAAGHLIAAIPLSRFFFDC